MHVGITLVPAMPSGHVEAGEVLDGVVEVEDAGPNAAGDAEDHGLSEEIAGRGISNARVGQSCAQGCGFGMGAGKVGGF